jgi:carbon-monoxide dehydrogenase medium subunit
MIQFQYVEPSSLDEALAALGQYGDEAKVIAGGTALVNLMKQRLVQPAYLIGLRKVPGLSGISNGNGLTIGAFTTHRDIEVSPVVKANAPLLAETFPLIASVRVRNVATLGGSLAHADPNQDPPPALIALDAKVRTRSPRGTREIAIDEFFTDYYETALEPDELVTEVVVPAQPANTGAAYLKFLPQTQDDYATVAAAARITLDGDRITDARIGVGSAGPTPIRATAVEDALRGQSANAAVFRDAAALVADAVDPTTDFRGSASYKRDMAVVFVRRALERAAERARGGA